MYLSIIIPAYNEEDNLIDTTSAFNDYLNRQPYDYEIIIVNDGSTDGTAAIAHEISKQEKTITLISNKINQGKGSAVRQGLAKANGDFRLFIDADNATSIDHLDKVWSQFSKGCQVVIGSRNYRDCPDAEQIIKQSFLKRTIGVLGNKLIQRLVDLNIWDTQCGFKIFTEEAAKQIIPKLTTNRWLFDAEMLVIAKSHNLKIGIIPVKWRNSSFSRVGLQGYINSLFDLLKIKLNILNKKY